MLPTKTGHGHQEEEKPELQVKANIGDRKESVDFPKPLLPPLLQPFAGLTLLRSAAHLL
jgi:hypothetical protein